MQIELEIKCPFCGKISNLIVDRDKFNDWYDNNRRVQDVFPYMPHEDRELLLSNVCKVCQKKTFG